MITLVDGFLNAAELARCADAYAQGPWQDSGDSAQPGARARKHSLRLGTDCPALPTLTTLLRSKLAQHPELATSIFPERLSATQWLRYDAGMGYGEHYDAPLLESGRVRADLAYTLFLSEPTRYEGGELVIDSDRQPQSFKPAEGSLLVYPASSLHCVNTVTAGSRWVAVGWVQSYLRDVSQRGILADLQLAAARLRALEPEGMAIKQLEKAQANLLRAWLTPS